MRSEALDDTLGTSTKKSTLIGRATHRQLRQALPARPRRNGWFGALPSRSLTDRSRNPGEKYMAGQVILYFDDQADALRFALAAGSVMAGENANASGDLVMETTRVCRILLDAVNAGKVKKPSPPERAA